MTLDPQAKAMLDMMASAGVPAFNTLPPEVARQVMGMMRPADAAVVEVGKVENRAIPGPGGDIPVRIYWPLGKATAQGLPVLMYYHGGGWVLGDLESHDGACRELANGAGCIVIAVDYRLAPEHKFPAAVDDSWAALEWGVANAASLGGDGARIAVGGDSAGGNLSAVLAQMAKARGGPPLRLQLLVYPVTDHRFDTASYTENGEGYFLTTDMMRWFSGHYLRSGADADDALASPLRAKSVEGLAPALLITAGYDPLRDEGEAYGARLKAAGVPISQTRYPGMFHGFFTMTGQIDQQAVAMKEATQALRAAFA